MCSSSGEEQMRYIEGTPREQMLLFPESIDDYTELYQSNSEKISPRARRVD